MVDTGVTDLDKLKNIFKWVYTCRFCPEYQWLYIHTLIYMKIYEYTYENMYILHLCVIYIYVNVYQYMYIHIYEYKLIYKYTEMG